MKSGARHVIPGFVFLVTMGLHYLWLGLFPAVDALQQGWTPPGVQPSWWGTYVAAGGYWLGYSYALSAAFAAAAFVGYWADRTRSTSRFVLGGFTFTGALAAGGCFLIGCCGSPMLVVWMNLFGAGFLPFAKPLMAGITTVTIGAAWIWMTVSRRRRLRLDGMATVEWETGA